MEERKFVQTVQVTRPRWSPCPYMVKTLKIFFSATKRPMTLKLGMQHRVLEFYQVCSNDDPGMTWQSTKSLHEALSTKGQGLSLTLFQITQDWIFLNFFSSITTDFNISSALRWTIQDQWSSVFFIPLVTFDPACYGLEISYMESLWKIGDPYCFSFPSYAPFWSYVLSKMGWKSY